MSGDTWDICVSRTIVDGQGGEPRKLIPESFIKNKCEIANKILKKLNFQINYLLL